MTHTPISEAEFQNGGCLCEHLLTAKEVDSRDIYYYFTGVKQAYHLICHECYRLPVPELNQMLRQTTEEWFAEVDENSKTGAAGRPEILTRPEKLKFQHRQIKGSFDEHLLAIQPTGLQAWIAVLKSGKIVYLDLNTPDFRVIADLVSNQFEFTEDIHLTVSSEGRFVAVANRFGQTGIVLDLSVNDHQITMRLDRGTYHIKHCMFPVAFFDHQDKTYIIHATTWNRLDISDPATGILLTPRNHEIVEPKQRPVHWLDYFHTRLLVSPDQHWIAEDGWVWHPMGTTRVWSLKRWLEDNIWESEDGDSARNLTQRLYGWHSPIQWIENTILAVLCFGDGDELLPPSLRLFDVVTGKRLSWFAGIQHGSLYFDTYLFAVGEAGTEIWDIHTGELLHFESALKPINWHPETKEFLSLLPDGMWQLSRLVTDDTPK